jgi:PIN domain-containing protein
MAGGHPDGLPTLFIDRSLGRRQVPDLLRAAGLRLHTLAEVYGIPGDETIADVEWLMRAGEEGWAVLMKDERIRYRPAERAAVVDNGVRAFCLTSGNLRAHEMADLYLSVLDRIVAACAEPGPFLHAVSRQGLRKLDLT